MPLRLNLPLVPEVETTNFAKEMGLESGEGLICAFIPIMNAVPQEVEFRDGKRNFTLVSLDGVVLDLVPQDQKTVKWWIVRTAARENKLQIPEPIWSGAAEDFRVEALPDLPQPENTILALRQYRCGPWIKLQEAPKVEPEKSEPIA